MFHVAEAIRMVVAGFTFLFLPVGVFAGPVNMNARHEAGGLVLQRRENIAMVSQEVYISAGLIEVNCMVLNHSKQDITTTVAFPLPQPQGTSASGALLPAVQGPAD